MDEAEEVLQKIKEHGEGPYSGEYMWWLSGTRKALRSMVADVKAGKPTTPRFFQEWDYIVSDGLDHMLGARLAEHVWNEDGHTPNFKKWSKFDTTLYKLFDELTAAFKQLVETCKPENEARIAANRAAAGLPNNAARNAQKAENKARYNVKAQAEKNLAAAERQAAKNAKKAEEQAAKNAKKAAMTNAERAKAANRAAKAAATRKAKQNAEAAAASAMLNQPRQTRSKIPKARKTRKV